MKVTKNLFECFYLANAATKFMINKKKRSLNLHAGDALKPRTLSAKIGAASEHRFNGPESRF